MRQSCFWLLRKVWPRSVTCSISRAPSRLIPASDVARSWRDVRPYSISTNTKLDYTQQSRLDRFQRTLLRASVSNCTEGDRAGLWHEYEKLKKHESLPLSLVSRSGWTRFWKLLSATSHVDAAHLSRLQILLDDMRAVNINIKRFSQALLIEQCFFEDDMAQASTIWLQGPDNSSKAIYNSESAAQSAPTVAMVNEHDSISLDHKLKVRLGSASFDQDWLELGIRVFSAMGEAECVSIIVSYLGSRVRSLDPRSSVYVSLALNHSRVSAQIQRAWTVFNTALRSPAYKLSFAELDAVCRSFLAANSLAHASSVLYILAENHRDKPTQAQHIFGSLHNQILSKVDSIELVDEVSLELLKYLPDARVQNTFFDTWLKASSRLGHSEHTSEIIELMFETGKSPQARHIDWLLRAWLDVKGDNRSMELESLALSMIQQRVDKAAGTEPGSSRSLERTLKMPKFLRRSLPAANTRTFILLMKNYAKSGDIDAAQQTLRLLDNASGVKLEAQMARAILAIHFTMADMKGGWRFFETLRKNPVLTSDHRTFAVLWKGMNLNLAVNKTGILDSFPDPRHLFAVMLLDLLKDLDVSDLPIDNGPRETTYERIVHCFCLSEDTPGLLLALHTMKAIYNIHPSQKTVLSVAQHISHRLALRMVADDHTNTFQGLVQQQTLQSMAILQRIWSRIQDLEPSHRFLSLAGVFEKPKPSLRRPRRDLEQAKGEELLLLLTLFIKNYLSLDHSLAQRFEKAIDRARHEMGLTGYPEINAKIEDLRRLSF